MNTDIVAIPSMETDTYRGPAPTTFHGVGLSGSVTVGRYEVADFPTLDDGSGGPGLLTKMRVIGSGSAWQPYDRAALAADRYLTSGHGLLDQNVWWTDKDGITLLVDSLSVDRRRYIARLLIDRAAAMHAKWSAAKQRNAYWSYLDWADEHDCVVYEAPPTGEGILAEVRAQQADGDHLDWMRSTPLFRRMIDGLDWTHPGVTGTSLDIGHNDRPVAPKATWDDVPEDF